MATRWTLLALIPALSGPLGYALGRVVVETFYGRFDVLPGEVGLGYDSLVAPTILIMFGTALIGLLMIQLGRLTLAIGGGIVLLVIYIFITEDSLHTWRSVGFIVLALVALGVLGVVGMLEESYGRPVWIALVSVITVTVATMAIATAAAAADDAEDGRPVSMTIRGIPITAIRATPVHVTGFPDVPSCMLFLGSADDVAILLDHTTVWRLPADVTMTMTGCP